MTDITRRDAQIIQDAHDAGFQPTLERPFGYVVSVGGSIEGDLPHLVWVQPADKPAAPPQQMFNPGYKEIAEGMRVYYYQNPLAPARLQIALPDKAHYADQPGVLSTLPEQGVELHASLHAMPPGAIGLDPLNIWTHAVVDLAVRPTSPASMRVTVYGGW
jgi:hypothetical protein